MATAAVIAGGTILGSVIGASGQKSAAKTQARAMDAASRPTAEAAERARRDVLNQIGPGLDAFRESIVASQGTLEGGAANVMKTLFASTAGADRILQSSGADAQRTLMGSELAAQGIPYSQVTRTLDQQYGPSPTTPQYSQSPDGTIQMQPGAEPGTYEPAPAPAAAPQQPEGLAGVFPQPGAAPQQPPGMLPVPTATPGIGFGAATGHLEGGRQAALGELAAGIGMGRGDIMEARTGALGAMRPYSEAGGQALQREAALSGALGPEAQQAAIAGFMESPGQKYLREQQEKALLRNQAAIGGLGGGNVRSALQEQAMGIASTRMQQDLENLRSLAGRGQQAAGAEADIYGTAGAGMAGLAQTLGISAANIQSMTAQQQAALADRMGITVAELQRQIGQQRAGLATGLGADVARTQAGLAGDIAGLQSREGTTELEVARGLGTTLANIATQSGTQLANIEAQKGSALAAGEYGAAQTIGQGVTGLAGIAGYGMMGGFQPLNQPNSQYFTPAAGVSTGAR
jgi:hypothetical protein